MPLAIPRKEHLQQKYPSNFRWEYLHPKWPDTNIKIFFAAAKYNKWKITICYKNARKYIHLLPLHEQLQEIGYFIDYYTNKPLKIRHSKRLSILTHLKEHKRITTADFNARYLPNQICRLSYV